MNVYIARAAFRAKCGKQSVGFVHWKIGLAADIEQCLVDLQAASPIPVEIVGALECADAVAAEAEREFKEWLADARVSGEWLSLNTRQTLAVHSLIENWPVASVRTFLGSLPKRIECNADIFRVQADYVPHAALHEARLQIKQLRAQVAESQEKVRISALTYKQVFDSAIEHLTEKYNKAIQSLQFRALH
jgi:hypothetical protein